ncbi:hypothetical protein O9992_15970 [Vibrio lentus]|nr:hypothetical protein [Vibrio lentus]
MPVAPSVFLQKVGEGAEARACGDVGLRAKLGESGGDWIYHFRWFFFKTKACLRTTEQPKERHK